MKKLYTILLLLTISIGANAQIALGNGLSACWPFTGNANDVSGNNFNGAVSNATLTSDRFGNPNQAYFYNGTNSYINFGNALNNVFAGAGNKFSISVWIKPAYILQLQVEYWQKMLMVHVLKHKTNLF